MTLSIAGEIVVAALLLGSGVLVLIAALGLWRLPDFFERMHAPSLAYTLAAWAVTLASIIAFWLFERRLSPHLVLVNVLLAISAPVTTVLLARAALFRRRQAGDAVPPSLSAGGRAAPADVAT
ncbi:MAG: monovalent cation/H(+) antiporter subunit G [Rhizobacter sp.]